MDEEGIGPLADGDHGHEGEGVPLVGGEQDLALLAVRGADVHGFAQDLHLLRRHRDGRLRLGRFRLRRLW